jgi:hypothetical protein
MTALPSTADIGRTRRHVRFVPGADIRREFKRQKSTYAPKIYDDLDHALDFARDALAQRLFVPLIEGTMGP